MGVPGSFDPDPDAVADGIEQHLAFLADIGFSVAGGSAESAAPVPGS